MLIAVFDVAGQHFIPNHSKPCFSSPTASHVDHSSGRSGPSQHPSLAGSVRLRCQTTSPASRRTHLCSAPAPRVPCVITFSRTKTSLPSVLLAPARRITAVTIRWVPAPGPPSAWVVLTVQILSPIFLPFQVFNSILSSVLGVHPSTLLAMAGNVVISAC